MADNNSYEAKNIKVLKGLDADRFKVERYNLAQQPAATHCRRMAMLPLVSPDG